MRRQLIPGLLFLMLAASGSPGRSQLPGAPPPPAGLGRRLAPSGTASGEASPVRRIPQEAAPGTEPADPRLRRKVTLLLKHAPLAEFCEVLSQRTGVRFSAAREVADENVTVLVEERPAADVMRAVARLFGWKWSRSGAPGEDRYTLVQDRKAQLAEEELRRQDLQAALLALDAEMGQFASYGTLTPDQLRARALQASGEEKERVDRCLRYWGGIQAYRRLTAAQRLALAQGQEVEFDPGSPDPERRLPAELRVPLLESSNLRLTRESRPQIAPVDGDSLAELPDAQPIVSLALSYDERGQVRLLASMGAYVASRPELGRAVYPNLLDPIVTGRSPAAGKQDNARENAALAAEPEFRKQVSVAPVSSCPHFAPGGTDHQEYPYFVAPDGSSQFARRPPHVFSGDAWEAVHRATGMPVVADAYTRLYTRDDVSMKDATAFAALVRVGDALGQRWRREGDFLLARSTSWFWDRRKEVPRRLLARWKQDREREKGLPLRDLLEMATLRDDQLRSAVIGVALEHCWGLEEWGLVGNPGFRMGAYYTELQPFARLLATFNAEQLAAALSPSGIIFEALLPAQREILAGHLSRKGRPAGFVDGMRLAVAYVPAGRYLWIPVVESEEAYARAASRPIVSGLTAEAALAAARKVDPGAEGGQISRCAGLLSIRCIPTQGSPWSVGELRIEVRGE